MRIFHAGWHVRPARKDSAGSALRWGKDLGLEDSVVVFRMNLSVDMV